MLSEAAMTACGPTVVTSCANSTVTRSRLVIAFGRRFSPTVSGSQGGLADGPATDSQVNINNAERSADLRQPACCCIGWLNVRSLSNKTTTVHETIVDVPGRFRCDGDMAPFQRPRQPEASDSGRLPATQANSAFHPFRVDK